MDCQVIVTPPAIEDLRVIAEYIAADNPARALTFGEELLARALETGALPKAGRVVPEISDPTVREVIHPSYRIVYKIDEPSGVVYIARSWHAARGDPEVAPKA